MAQLAILIAILLIFAFTPLGYLSTSLVEITFLPLPVALGAILFGPAAGALLGGIFGITSLIQCFGTSAMGTVMFQWNPVGMIFTLLGARILCGWLAGWVFCGLRKIDRTKIVSYYVASLCTALFNTIFYMAGMLIFFWHDDRFIGLMTDYGLPTRNIWVFLVGFVGLNGVIEAIVNFIIGGTVSKVCVRFVNGEKGASHSVPEEIVTETASESGQIIHSEQANTAEQTNDTDKQ